MEISVCATNYNCAHALVPHLESVYRNLDGLDFEYIVVDNRSEDGSRRILEDWRSHHSNMRTRYQRCTMGEGRQIAFGLSAGYRILVLDTDVVYADLLRRFVDCCIDHCPDLSVQAIWGAMFVRDQWDRVGGRRSLNTNEDADMWLRVHRLGTMRWYPVRLGDNLKEVAAWGRADHLSARYSPNVRILRLLRREWDLWKTREVERTDLGALIEANTIDLGIAPALHGWPQNRSRRSGPPRIVMLARELKQAWLSP